MTTQQVIQLVVIALAIGLSAIGALIRKLSEQAALRRAQEQMLRRRDESLRTGRGSHEDESEAAQPTAGPRMPLAQSQGAPVGADEARRRFQEIAQRRRAEIEAQRAPRKGGQQVQGGDGRALPPSPPIVVFGPGGAQVVRPIRPGAPRPFAPAPQSGHGSGGRMVAGRRDGSRAVTPQERQAEARRRVVQEQQARDRAFYEQSDREAVAAQRARLVQAAARSEAAETAASERGMNRAGLTGALERIAGAADQSETGVRVGELRRAVVLGELLGPPVSTRPQN